MVGQSTYCGLEEEIVKEWFFSFMVSSASAVMSMRKISDPINLQEAVTLCLSLNDIYRRAEASKVHGDVSVCLLQEYRPCSSYPGPSVPLYPAQCSGSPCGDRAPRLWIPVITV